MHSVNVLRQRRLRSVVTVERDEKKSGNTKVDQLKFKPRKKKGKGGGEKHGGDTRTQSLSSWKPQRRGKSKLDDN